MSVVARPGDDDMTTGNRMRAGLAVAMLAVTIGSGALAQTSAKKKAPPKPQLPPATALVGGAVIDGRGGPPIAHGVVVFRAGKIIAVGRLGKVIVPQGARVIRVDGKTVLPGLIDAHMHIGGSGGGSADAREFTPQATANNFRSYLKFGVTTVFDIAGNPFLEVQKQALASGQILGPRLFGVKYGITAPGSHPMGLLKEYKLTKLLGPVYPLVSTVEQARATIARIAADDIDGVKIMNSRSEFPGTSRYDADRPKLSRAVLKALIESAHAKGLRVFVHVAFPSEAREAVEAGADVLAHSIGMAETGTEAIFRLMAARGVAYMPTLAQIEAVYGLQADPFRLERLRGKVWDVILDSVTHANSVVRARHRMPGLVADARRNLAISMANLRRAVKAGVKIVMGTDAGNAGTFHGATVPREMELMRQAGMTPMQTIVAATRHAAEVIGQKDRLGTIEKGKLADLVVIDGDPLHDISTIANVVTVVRNGYVIDVAGIPFQQAPNQPAIRLFK